MPQPHSTKNYTVLKGIFSIALFANGVPGVYSDMGNAVTAEYEPVLERLPHYSNRSGFRTKDANPVISTEYNLRITLDEFAAVNLKKYLMGATAGLGIQMLDDVDKEYAVRFIEDNPRGPNKTWNFWKGTIGPNGALQLVGDGTAWAVMEMLFTGLADTGNHPESPYGTVTYMSGETSTTTSTTTTTTTS
jgi:hypothetical protein